MSLFKTKNIWTASTEDDLYDLGCLKVANIGVNKSNFNSIITGSYNGFLRIFNPLVKKENEKKGYKDDEEMAGFVRSHDLVCEISFPAPIIQIEIGRFVR
jgi:Bardet-Biedl syndrome 9 protein